MLWHSKDSSNSSECSGQEENIEKLLSYYGINVKNARGVLLWRIIPKKCLYSNSLRSLILLKNGACPLTSQSFIMRTFPRCIKCITIQELRQQTPLWTFCICQILGERSSQHLRPSGWAETAVQAPLLWHSRVHYGETLFQWEYSGGFTRVTHCSFE